MPVLSAMYWFVIVFIWIAIAFWPARVAAAKGHSFFGYFVLSLFFFPLAIIMAYAVEDRTATQAAAPAPAQTSTEEV